MYNHYSQKPLRKIIQKQKICYVKGKPASRNIVSHSLRVNSLRVIFPLPVPRNQVFVYIEKTFLQTQRKDIALKLCILIYSMSFCASTTCKMFGTKSSNCLIDRSTGFIIQTLISPGIVCISRDRLTHHHHINVWPLCSCDLERILCMEHQFTTPIVLTALTRHCAVLTELGWYENQLFVSLNEGKSQNVFASLWQEVAAGFISYTHVARSASILKTWSLHMWTSAEFAAVCCKWKWKQLWKWVSCSREIAFSW